MQARALLSVPFRDSRGSHACIERPGDVWQNLPMFRTVAHRRSQCASGHVMSVYSRPGPAFVRTTRLPAWCSTKYCSPGVRRCTSRGVPPGSSTRSRCTCAAVQIVNSVVSTGACFSDTMKVLDGRSECQEYPSSPGRCAGTLALPEYSSISFTSSRLPGSYLVPICGRTSRSPAGQQRSSSCVPGVASGTRGLDSAAPMCAAEHGTGPMLTHACSLPTSRGGQSELHLNMVSSVRRVNRL